MDKKIISYLEERVNGLATGLEVSKFVPELVSHLSEKHGHEIDKKIIGYPKHGVDGDMKTRDEETELEK